ncbi:MAG TPA: ATP-dependent RecD-like DNA helicase [Clostridia bacterium]|nr:ATP-dependent RecD-like DNA helicase [Clostridia bacterium]
MEKLNGIVERITYVNEENGFSVIKIKVKGQSELVTVVGNIAFVNIGAVVELEGEWSFNSKYGQQFKVNSCVEKIPATVAGIERYLGSGLIKGIGPVNAKRIVKKFKEDTIQIIEEEPERLSEVEGIGPKRVEMIKDAWLEQKEIKNVMLFLQEHEVSVAYAVKIYKTYGNASISVVKENPYRLADDIWGIGFKIADKIATKLGFEQNSYVRCRAGLIYVLNQVANEGHCFAFREQLLQEAVEMLEIEQVLLEKALEDMLKEEIIVQEGEDKFYLPSFYYSEVGVAKRIKEIMVTKKPFAFSNIETIIKEIQRENNIVYDQVQLEAIKVACDSKFMVLTGGPGTGKTTTTLAIIRVLEKMQAKILLAAPTGRAAKRLSEATGREARTLHRLLEYKPPHGYEKDFGNPLDGDVLIVDEMSMVDIVLMYNLLKAVPNKAMVVLVGDMDQLPSVGPGNVLRDIINSGVVKVVKLTRIFRQAQGSRIITNAHKINKGHFPYLKGGRKSDFFFIEESEPLSIVEQIKGLCAHRLPTYYAVDPIDDIQVLTPMQRGVIGVRNLNEVLQEALNPAKTQVTYGGIKYKLNDKVMQIKNNYDKNIFNGDIGRIVALDQEEKKVLVRFDQQVVNYDVAELDEVVLAYATTIHKSQGSEFKIVVAPIVTQHFIMLQRNLLYTCVTRAKKVMVLLGTKKALAIALKNNKVELRNTMLEARLTEQEKV